ncbi:pentatricopeptide repeat-containing protein At3g49730 [Sorghum bicolor]|uniref:pentatricopeptide repeat-containing protein At3g49730 n=1 Tax=Sorghum bicolor TaxID=4558 RepID=UPI00081AD938|nr:pentatricopeptide repeat-containing protein At3g49730 [Sorghum bicolor]|eukprot:XP_002466528.2 pentatricopeptide repeat-containing protein At3g49730 [Sorghum bicolor]
MRCLLSTPLRRGLSTAAADDPSLASSAEHAYRLLRRHHSDPQRLAAALSASGLDASSPHLLDAVLRRCGAASSLALHFFHWCSPSLPSPLPSSLALLAKSFSRASSAPSPSLLAPLPSQLLGPSLLCPVLRRLPQPRLLPFALSLLSARPDHDQPALFLSLLESLSKAGHVVTAEQLVEEPQTRFPLSLRHYTALLYGWCRQGKLDEAKHVLARMKAADVALDVVAFNTLLAGFVADGRFEDAFELTGQMEQRGCPPNAVSYTTLIQGLGARGRVDEAMRVFVEMRRKGCAPDAVTYGTLVSTFCKAGKISQGYEFLDAISRDGLRVDAAVYHGFFVAHEKKEQLEECLELMERMRECRCPPDLKIYNVVIRLACRLGETKQAMSLWNEMETGGLSPGVDTFAIMVNGLVGQGLLVEACSYFKDMVGRGLFVAPQYGVLKDLLNALVRDEKLELAKDVWECIASKGCELNVSAWTIWIHALYAKKHVKEACLYCLDMLEAGVMPQPDTFAKLMKGLKKLYNRQIAAEITEKVRKMAEERHVSFKMYKRRGVRDLEAKPKAKRRGQKQRRQGQRGHVMEFGFDRGEEKEKDYQPDQKCCTARTSHLHQLE